MPLAQSSGTAAIDDDDKTRSVRIFALHKSIAVLIAATLAGGCCNRPSDKTVFFQDSFEAREIEHNLRKWTTKSEFPWAKIGEFAETMDTGNPRRWLKVASDKEAEVMSRDVAYALFWRNFFVPSIQLSQIVNYYRLRELGFTFEVFPQEGYLPSIIMGNKWAVLDDEDRWLINTGFDGSGWLLIVVTTPSEIHREPSQEEIDYVIKYGRIVAISTCIDVEADPSTRR
jgi:hypothetical protein